MGKEFEISRTFDAPRDLVWRAFTEADRLAKWWGPKGFDMVVSNLDFRSGGSYHYCMRSPQGQEMWGIFHYREVNPKDSIVYVSSFSDKDRNLTRHAMAPIWPLEVLNHQTFAEVDGKTTVTLRGGPINCSDEERAVYECMFDSMRAGFGGTFDQLAAYLKSEE